MNYDLASRIAHQANPHDISMANVLAFLEHYETARRLIDFAPANARVIARVLALAATGHERIVRMGTTNDRIYIRTDGGLRAIDPRTREVVGMSEKATNVLLGKSLLEHVHQAHNGSHFFSAYPARNNELVFVINDKRVAVPPGELSPGTLQALAEMLIAGTEPDADVIFTTQPQLLNDQRERVRDISFSLAESVRAAGGRRLCFDDFNDDTRTRAMALRQSSADASMVALVADESFNVADARVIQNTEGDLEASGINVEHVGATGDVTVPSESVAIVITGHSAPELSTFVRRLVDQGVFRGKMVILNSCGTSLTAELADSVVRQGGATAVLQHKGVITASQVRVFMRATIDGRSTKVLSELINARPHHRGGMDGQPRMSGRVPRCCGCRVASRGTSGSVESSYARSPGREPFHSFSQR